VFPRISFLQIFPAKPLHTFYIFPMHTPVRIYINRHLFSSFYNSSSDVCFLKYKFMLIYTHFFSLANFWVPCFLFRILPSNILHHYSSLNFKEQISVPLKLQAILHPNTLTHQNSDIILSVTSFGFKTPTLCLRFLFISSV
jgi:hypothetical protein